MFFDLNSGTLPFPGVGVATARWGALIVATMDSGCRCTVTTVVCRCAQKQDFKLDKHLVESLFEVRADLLKELRYTLSTFCLEILEDVTNLCLLTCSLIPNLLLIYVPLFVELISFPPVLEI